MSDKLTINLNLVESTAEIEFIGSIDEDANFEKVKNLAQDDYKFDFEKRC